MDAILAIADAARAAGRSRTTRTACSARYKGRPLGTFGALATLSFHETKNFTCGEGGALLDQRRALHRARRDHPREGHEPQPLLPRPGRQVHLGRRRLELPASDMLAAFLLAQLESHEQIQRRRHALWSRYFEALAPRAAAAGVRMPMVPEHCGHPAHIFYVLMPTLEARTRLLASLRAQLILAVFHYLPLHLSEMGRRLGGRDGQFPVTESVCDRLVRLPIFYQLTDDDQARVIGAVSDAWSA